jgi:hypothetical protein
MKNSFRAAIEDQYGIHIQDCQKAARGQVATETYVLLGLRPN